jgi:hypothetical protein
MPPKSEAHSSKGPSLSPSDSLALYGWVDDGGSLPLSTGRPARKPRLSKQPADTVAGCRDRAAADLLAAAVMSTRNEQLRMEASSASWGARADLLQRMDDTFEARMKAQQLMR